MSIEEPESIPEISPLGKEIMEPISPLLEQWRQVIQQLKGPSRPKMNLQIKRHYAAVLAEALTDTGLPLDQVFPDLYLLPNGVVGIAFGSTCDRLTPERRGAVSTWISNQQQEHSDTERAYALRGLLRSSPLDAFGALFSMRSSPPKERRERIASGLSEVAADEIASIFCKPEGT